MFANCINFNQDLSTWCVQLILIAPFSFSSGAVSWVLPQPMWGITSSPPC